MNTNMEEFIKMHEGFIYKIANKFYNVPKEDLFQAGAMGLLKAYKNYKNQGTTKFSTYAYDYVFGEMYQMVHKNQALKISRDTLQLYKRIELTRSALAQKLHKIPNNEEVALFLEMDPMVVEQAIASGQSIMSFDDNPETERDLYETVSCDTTLSLDDSLTLQECLEELNPEEKKIIQYRYFNDLTQSETARKLNMTQVMVSRYEKKGISKMRQYYDIT